MPVVTCRPPAASVHLLAASCLWATAHEVTTVFFGGWEGSCHVLKQHLHRFLLHAAIPGTDSLWSGCQGDVVVSSVC